MQKICYLHLTNKVRNATFFAIVPFGVSYTVLDVDSFLFFASLFYSRIFFPLVVVIELFIIKNQEQCEIAYILLFRCCIYVKYRKLCAIKFNTNLSSNKVPVLSCMRSKRSVIVPKRLNTYGIMKFKCLLPHALSHTHTFAQKKGAEDRLTGFISYFFPLDFANLFSRANHFGFSAYLVSSGGERREENG